MKDINKFLVSTQPLHGGVQKRYLFPNGYGASVVRHQYSYGYPSLWELAVTDGLGELVYDTPITSDVIGHLSDDQVNAYLKLIHDLPPRNSKENPSYANKN